MRTWISRLLEPFFGSRRERRLTEEIDAHVEMLAEEYEAGGLAPAEARAAARRAFGGIDQMKLRHRDQRGFPLVDALVQDLAFALRLLVRERVLSASIVGALALGIGATVTVFAILNAMLLRDVPYLEDPDRVVAIDALDGRGRPTGVSLPDLGDWREAQSFAGMAAYAASAATLADGVKPADHLNGVYVGAGTFELLGAAPAFGRSLRPDDDRPGAPPVVLLGYGLWVDRFGADPAVVGRMLRINGASASVVGVMPAGFTFPLTGDVWIPLAHLPGLKHAVRDARSLTVVARLANEVTMAEARSELETVAAGLAAQYPDSNRGIRPVVVTFVSRYLGTLTSPEPLVLVGSVTLLLLIACANASSLLLTRSAARAREIALRAALGASRSRIVSQLVVESLLLACVSGLAGFALATGAVTLFASTTAALGLPPWTRFEMDGNVFAFVAAICLGTGMMFGCAPALHLSRGATPAALKDGGRGFAGSARTGRFMRLLLVGQVALAVILLAAASTLVQRSRALYEIDHAIAPDEVLTGRLTLPSASYGAPGARARFVTALYERLSALPGVRAGTIATAIPFAGAASANLEWEGQRDVSAPGPSVCTVGIAGSYLETLNLPLLIGRASRPGETEAVVNQAFVGALTADSSPLGRRLRLVRPASAETSPWMTIVGVVPSVRQTPGGDARPCVYVPIEHASGSNLAIMARVTGDPAALTPSFRAVIARLDADLPLYNVHTLAQVSHMARWGSRTVSVVLSIFALIAFALSMAGVYSVTATGVSQRTQEIGVRLTLGATRRDIISAVMQRVTPAVIAGLAIGIGGGLVVMRIMRSVLVGPDDGGPATVGALAAVIVTVVAIACSVPVRRALRVDPSQTLRVD